MRTPKVRGKSFFGAEGAQKIKIRVPNKRFPGICHGTKIQGLIVR